MYHFSRLKDVVSKASKKIIEKEKSTIQYLKDHAITRDHLRDYAKGFTNNSKQRFRDNSENLKQSGKESLKYQFRQLPYYTYVVSKTGIKYTYYVGKYALRTPPGRFVKGLGISYLIGRMGYVYGTHGHCDITVNHKFWRYDDNDQDSKNGYMITDQHGNIYGVRNSIWFLQPYSTEL